MFYLHAYIIDKKVGIKEAQKRAREVLQRSRLNPHVENETSYVFRNIPKNKFNPYSFKVQKIDDDTAMVVGKLKESSNQE